MADKKDKDNFNNPFSALKGLSVSGPEKTEKKPAPQPVRPVEEPKPAVEADADFFSRPEVAGYFASLGLPASPPDQRISGRGRYKLSMLRTHLCAAQRT